MEIARNSVLRQVRAYVHTETRVVKIKPTQQTLQFLNRQGGYKLVDMGYCESMQKRTLRLPVALHTPV